MADLSVPQFDVHGVRLVLEVLDLRADGPQVSLGRRRRRRRRRRRFRNGNECGVVSRLT